MSWLPVVAADTSVPGQSTDASLALRDLLVTLLALAALLLWDASRLDLPLDRWFGDASGFAWRQHWLTASVLHEGGRRLAAVIVLGAVIRGGTPHFDMIAAEVTKGTAQVGLDTGIPVVFGVLTTDTVEQAIERAGTKMGNKGWEAAQSMIEMVDLLRALKTGKGAK